MTCEFDKTKLILYLFDELSPGEKDEIVNHLDSCHACQSELAQLKSSVNFYKSQQEIDPPALKFVTRPQQKNLVRQRWTR
jgi:anti-sigma factor RsiW